MESHPPVKVPGKALKHKNAPVIFAIHGGGYIGGSKGGGNPDNNVFNATGIALNTNGTAILVTINYRLGVLGWLNGSEAKKAKATNLGLHDQRAALEWVQKYIHLVGGNPQDVSAWGLSAGGGSILHHITQYDGRRDPLFKKAFVQSPGWFNDWDLPEIDRSFQNFTKKLGCTTVDTFGCLRRANLSDLTAASSNLRGLQPREDGDWIASTPLVAFKKSNMPR
ncbi:hypothetical protein LCI18_014643 [Fusarium solani-melongenae]|uniref:Uncharacterized protein n=1 Tax=Fusarium solani subsp. cucurbitae TaxID=2747967 RepID=A0ACD3ZRK1_FUSSC|nr:hypothetical protein LCI18_014643 [Fusarium solani-melongenae]